MTPIYQTTGIVLSRRDWREADRVFSVLTRDRGKIELVGRGGRKPLAKLSSHMEQCAESDFTVVSGRYNDTLAGVERKRAFPGIYNDFSTTLLAHQALHLVDFGTKPNEADPILYDQIINWLDFLDSAPEFSTERSAFLLAAFSMKFLAILGYRPELMHCLSCKSPIAQDSFRWHALKGGVVCDDCVLHNQEEWFAARKISSDALKLVRFAFSESFPELTRMRLDPENLLAYHDAVESLIISHFPTIPAVSIRGAVTV